MAEPTQDNNPPTNEDKNATGTNSTTPVDLTKISGEELTKVLENPQLFKLPRIQQALEAEKQLKKVQTEQEKAREQSLVEQKKFEDLANERGQTIETLNKQIQDSKVTNALTLKLSSESVVDLDAALKLVDQSKVSIDENGNVSGVDEAIEALKTDKAYLFNTNGVPKVGNPSNPSNPAQPGTGRFKYKESQMTPEFFEANKKDIMEAYRLGLIEQDGPPQQ